MSRFFNLLAAIMFVAIFSGSPVFSSEIAETSDKTITGLLVRVDVKTRCIYIKENSRIVKFKASAEMCETFKDRIYSEIDIKYKIGDNKTLMIITIVNSAKKDDSGKTQVKTKAPVKGRLKK